MRKSQLSPVSGPLHRSSVVFDLMNSFTPMLPVGPSLLWIITTVEYTSLSFLPLLSLLLLLVISCPLIYYLAVFFFHSALELNGSLFCVRWLFELLWKMYKRQSVGKFIAMETVSLTVRTVCNARACVYKDCVSASFK